MDLGLQDRVVVLAGPDAPDRTAGAEALSAEGCRVSTVADFGDAAAEVQRAVRDHGRVDAVVVYLPLRPDQPAVAATIEDLYATWSWVEQIAAAFRAAVPGMAERGWGRLVTVITGDVKALGEHADEVGALAGLGLLGMHKAAVADVARFGISANAVLRDAASAPAEVAATVAFLVSEPAGYLQGVTMSLDGARSPVMF